jgi:hypothetical protein
MQTCFLVHGHLSFRITFHSVKYGSTLSRTEKSDINYYSKKKSGVLKKIPILVLILRIFPNSDF